MNPNNHNGMVIVDVDQQNPMIWGLNNHNGNAINVPQHPIILDFENQAPADPNKKIHRCLLYFTIALAIVNLCLTLICTIALANVNQTPIPEHLWKGTSLKFKNPNGTWGEAVDLKGDIGPVPSHHWVGTYLQFEQKEGTWGKAVDLRGEQGDPGIDGVTPSHQWMGTSLQFEQKDGSWGTLVDLEGEVGADGSIPSHQWIGTSLQFQESDGSWGAAVDLLGDPGTDATSTPDFASDWFQVEGSNQYFLPHGLDSSAVRSIEIFFKFSSSDSTYYPLGMQGDTTDNCGAQARFDSTYIYVHRAGGCWGYAYNGAAHDVLDNGYIKILMWA